MNPDDFLGLKRERNERVRFEEREIFFINEGGLIFWLFIGRLYEAVLGIYTTLFWASKSPRIRAF